LKKTKTFFHKGLGLRKNKFLKRLTPALIRGSSVRILLSVSLLISLLAKGLTGLICFKKELGIGV
jgi:hypothetical protein